MRIEARRTEGFRRRSSGAEVVVEEIPQAGRTTACRDVELTYCQLCNQVGFNNAAHICAQAKGLAADIPAHGVLELISVFPRTLWDVLR